MIRFIKTCLGLIIAFTFTFCKKEKTIKREYYDTGELYQVMTYNSKNQLDGNLEVYYKNGNLKGIAKYENGKIVDTIKKFYKGGSIESLTFRKSGVDSTYFYLEDNQNSFSRGRIDSNGKKVGIWETFDNERQFKIVEQYITLESESVLNTSKVYNLLNNKVIDSISNYYYFDIPDTLNTNQEYNVSLKYISPMVINKNDLNNSEFVFCYSDNLAHDFSNYRTADYDTVFRQPDGSLEFLYERSKPGRVSIRGKVYEQFFTIKKDAKSGDRELLKNFKEVFVDKELFFIDKDK